MTDVLAATAIALLCLGFWLAWNSTSDLMSKPRWLVKVIAARLCWWGAMWIGIYLGVV